jgi:hypothetical protein
MKLLTSVAVMLLASTLHGCATTGMTVTTIDRSGRTETKTYTNHYIAGEWAVPGEVGLEVWIDHEKKVGPLYGLQRATGTLGPSDLNATGLVTVYFVNLETKPMQVTDLGISLTDGKVAPLQIQSLDLAPRALTKVVPGSFPISNYGTAVGLSVQFKLDGVLHSASPTLHRLTESEMPHPRKDFPWFKAPYFPFDPPLALPKESPREP